MNSKSHRPVPNKEAMDVALEHLRNMDVDEFKKSLVKAGSHTADGKLIPALKDLPPKDKKEIKRFIEFLELVNRLKLDGLNRLRATDIAYLEVYGKNKK